MPEPLADKIIQKLNQVAELYYRLILVVAPVGAGKTIDLQNISEQMGIPLININLELSRRMLDLTERQRTLQIPRLLSEIVNGADSSTVLLDNTEILFDVTLQQDPLRLLQGLSRCKTVVASWNGNIDNDYLKYAIPGHPEYRRYRIQDFLVVSLDAMT